MPNFSTTSGAQLNEAMKIQKEAEMGLSDQLEVQRSLKLKIEAQRRYLERITEDFKNRVSITKSSNKTFFPRVSLTSFCEDSESNPKEFESDSEIDKIEVRSQEESRAPKRPRTKENALLQKYMVASLDSKSRNRSLFFLWSVTALNSPLVPSLYTSYNYPT